MCTGRTYPFLLAAGVLLATLLAFLAPPKPARAQAEHRLYLPLISGIPGRELPNGDFEAGRTVWTESSKLGYPLIVAAADLPRGIAPHGGDWSAWLGGDYGERASVRQNIFVDADVAYLAFWQWLDWPFPCGGNTGATATVTIDEAVIYQNEVCEATTTGGWVKQMVDISAFAGRSVVLRFQLTTGSETAANMFLDDISLEGAP
jgi:hypothetical protein